MRLVICEKPSVARDLAKVLGANRNRRTHFEGEGLRITWCFGHMCELEEPAHYRPEWKKWSIESLPMIPEKFSLRLRSDVMEHWKAVKALMADKGTTEVVNACDAGREGELIFRYVYQMAESKQPVTRFWVSSLTPEAIKAGWADLKPGTEFNRLADAARCRSEADWLVGLNATRAMTCMVRRAGGDQLLSIGRVQTPTLALIVNRDEGIANFTPQTFWRVEATFTTMIDEEGEEKEASWTAKFFKGKLNQKEEKSGEVSLAERMDNEDDAKSICTAAAGQTGVIKQAKGKKKTEQPPLLYDLNSLQQRANQKYGFSAQKTLDLAQALYEKHKLLTYPRTDARYLTPDQEATIPGVMKGLKSVPPYLPFIEELLSSKLKKGKRIYNAAEVGDHHAIIPTGKDPMSCRMSPDEKWIFDLVSRRFLAAYMPNAIFSLSKVVVELPPKEGIELPEDVSSPLRFRAKGKIRLEAGWQAVDPPSKHKDKQLPPVKAGAPATAKDPKTIEGKTRPPPAYTEASLLGAMERAGKELKDDELKRAMRSAGLGTAATRSGIIETLIRRGFIKREKKKILSTPRGQNLIHAVPVDELKSAEMTGKWEARMTGISEGKDDRKEFMADVKQNLRKLIKTISSSAPPAPERIAAESDEPDLGECPKCGAAVRKRGPVFTCDTGRSCEFYIYKEIAGRKVSPRMVKSLLKDKKTQHLKGFKSKKTGNNFEAALYMTEDGKVKFDFSASPKREKKSPQQPQNFQPADPTVTPVGMICPKCKKGKLIQGRTAWGCNQWKEGCNYRFSFEHDGMRISAEEAVKRIRQQPGFQL